MPILLTPVVLIGLCAAGFWLWMLVDCLNNKNLSGSQRCCWALFIFYACLVGAIAYAFAGRSSQATSGAPVSQAPLHLDREPVSPEAARPYQEGYPPQPFHQDERASTEKVAVEHMPMQSQARYEDIQIAYPEDPR